MRRDRLEEKIKQLMEDEKEMFWEKVQKAINCGALDIEAYGDDFVLPKIIVSAVHTEMAWQYLPYAKEQQKEVKNLNKFL